MKVDDFEWFEVWLVAGSILLGAGLIGIVDKGFLGLVLLLPGLALQTVGVILRRKHLLKYEFYLKQ